VVVVTGNHYWLDVLAAIPLVLLGLAVADTSAYLWRRRRGETAETPSASQRTVREIRSVSGRG
jgi:hypothetical protein